jgi:hypothetical protein
LGIRGRLYLHPAGFGDAGFSLWKTGNSPGETGTVGAGDLEPKNLCFSPRTSQMGEKEVQAELRSPHPGPQAHGVAGRWSAWRALPAAHPRQRRQAPRGLAAAVLKIPRKLIWAGAQAVTRTAGGRERERKGGRDASERSESKSERGPESERGAGRGAAAHLAGLQRAARGARRPAGRPQLRPRGTLAWPGLACRLRSPHAQHDYPPQPHSRVGAAIDPYLGRTPASRSILRSSSACGGALPRPGREGP